jgi:flagellin-like protein
MTFAKRKAVSPVIATVILVAVAITVAVAVSYWMSGISSQYTQFEKVEIQSGVCTVVGDDWQVKIKLKNTGTATATLNGLFINDLEVNVYGASAAADTQAATNMTTSTQITSGATQIVMVYIDGADASTPWGTVSSGTTVNIKVHSAGGMDYIKLIELV